ncbi:MAG TPA: hypothetical protein VMC80_01310 [Patescibacteria group bacterium]|nr:hypothetical protein [Patescibacteria group bacterium]
MILKKISLKNIRSYENNELEFPEGSVLLSGDIGSGKTSILLGIEFALFGLQPGQRGSSLLRNGEKEGKVVMEFEIEDKNIILERTLKRGKTISQDYCSIEIDGDKKELSVTELKNKVLELLNYPAEFSKKQNILYKFTVYTPQEEMKQIILHDPETRMNTIRNIFGIDKYKKILENISIIAVKIREEKRMKEGMTSTFEDDKSELALRENEIKFKESAVIVAEKELLTKKEKRVRVQEEKDEFSKKIEERKKLQQEIEKTKIMIVNKKDSISDNKKSYSQLEEQVEKLKGLKFDESEIKKIEDELKISKKEKDKLNEENLRVSSDISSFTLKNDDIRKLDARLSKIEICPTCLQNVDSVYKANALNKIHTDEVENTKKIKELMKESMKLSESLGKKENEISEKQERIQELKILKIRLEEVKEKQKRIEDLKNLNISMDKDILLLNQHTELLKTSVFELSKYDNIFELKQKELDEAVREERLAEINVAELKKEIEFFHRQIDSLKEKIKKIEEIKKQLSYLTELEDWLSNKFTSVISMIETNVMIKLKAQFSKLFAEWFSMLVSDTFNVRLSDDFTPIIEQQDYEIEYEYLSGGERTAIALAYRLALNQVINSFLSKIKTKDLVILDEPTDGFSEQQLDKMRDILQQLNVRQLIIVSHEKEIEGFVDNVIRLKKENGSSRKEEFLIP